MDEHHCRVRARIKRLLARASNGAPALRSDFKSLRLRNQDYSHRCRPFGNLLITGSSKPPLQSTEFRQRARRIHRFKAELHKCC
ncbi:hypothetical protein GUJ93_ZPchr0006g44374 [Zizania palustris]|uniref:Uncharacterized protein n=1 Tax=Zizania palustris TaxID=103762 RepID=A0A8J5SCT3_ZIZPA|nr:hypothetical protein GUJ93_ZPchr0006g44374 [Zizania palustris]